MIYFQPARASNYERIDYRKIYVIVGKTDEWKVLKIQTKFQKNRKISRIPMQKRLYKRLTFKGGNEEYKTNTKIKKKT